MARPQPRPVLLTRLVTGVCVDCDQYADVIVSDASTLDPDRFRCDSCACAHDTGADNRQG